MDNDLKLNVYKFSERIPKHDEHILISIIHHDFPGTGNMSTNTGLKKFRVHFPSLHNKNKYMPNYFELYDRKDVLTDYKEEDFVNSIYFVINEFQKMAEDYQEESKS